MRFRVPAVLPLAIGVLLVLDSGLQAQDSSQEERLRKLEEQLRRQQEEIDELKRRQAAEENGFAVTFADGLHFRSRDGAFDLHFGGRYEEQFRDILDRPGSSRT